MLCCFRSHLASPQDDHHAALRIGETVGRYEIWFSRASHGGVRELALPRPPPLVRRLASPLVTQASEMLKYVLRDMHPVPSCFPQKYLAAVWLPAVNPLLHEQGYHLDLQAKRTRGGGSRKKIKTVVVSVNRLIPEEDEDPEDWPEHRPEDRPEDPPHIPPMAPPSYAEAVQGEQNQENPPDYAEYQRMHASRE